jgi:hypothetical protein
MDLSLDPATSPLFQPSKDEDQRLLALPRELRDEIWRYNFAGGDYSFKDREYTFAGDETMDGKAQCRLPGLLRTNRLIRNEALLYFFRLTRFRMSTRCFLTHWASDPDPGAATVQRLATMPEDHLTLIRATEVLVPVDYRPLELNKPWPNLEWRIMGICRQSVELEMPKAGLDSRAGVMRWRLERLFGPWTGPTLWPRPWRGPGKQPVTAGRVEYR